MENNNSSKGEEIKVQPYRLISSKFLGRNEFGHYTYELTFNQSMVHTGRWKGIEDGLNAYRENEMKEEEQRILEEAEKIKQKYNSQKQKENKI